MVTHRWWGSKFCKRTCKDAYLREVTLDRETSGLAYESLARHKPLAVPLYGLPSNRGHATLRLPSEGTALRYFSKQTTLSDWNQR